MGGSSHEPPSKKEKKELQRRVNHIGVQGPFIKTRWSHMPITFSQDDLRLKDYPHNDAMVINYNIGGYIIHDALVDNGSAADILMAKAFRQMNLGDSVLEPATNPLCGFGGRKVEALGKITLQVSFGQIDNARTKCIWGIKTGDQRGCEREPIKISSQIDPSAYIPKSPQTLKSSRWSLEKLWKS